jgi:hypothetical protein
VALGNAPPDHGSRPEPLRPAENEMVTAVARGEKLSYPGPFGLAAMRSWGPSRTIRAAALRHLLVEDEWQVQARGVHLRGVRISGHLDLEGATLRCPLRLDHCYLPGLQPVNLDYATAPLLALTRCHLTGLRGDLLTVIRDLDLAASKFTSHATLRGAHITGGLNCRGTRLTSAHQARDTLIADGPMEPGHRPDATHTQPSASH